MEKQECPRCRRMVTTLDGGRSAFHYSMVSGLGLQCLDDADAPMPGTCAVCHRSDVRVDPLTLLVEFHTAQGWSGQSVLVEQPPCGGVGKPPVQPPGV